MSDEMEEGQRYYAEVWAKSKKREQRSYLFATASIILALLQGMALTALLPLKETQLAVVKVDEAKGEVSVSRGGIEETFYHNEGIKKELIKNYIRARLTYDFQDYEENYLAVAYRSSNEIYREFAVEADWDREDGPYQVLGDNGQILVHVRSIALLNDGTARASIYTQKKVRGNMEPKQAFMITLSFQYRAEQHPNAEIYDNPLGFQVTAWRQDAETLRD